MKNEKIYNKLVRDSIPEIIENTGSSYKIHIADKDEYEGELHEKLLEEARELSEEPCEEEIADVLEVIDSLVKFYGFSRESINKLKENKRDERGGFEKRIILEKVIEKKEEKRMLFIQYPKCSTCKKAKKWLQENEITFEDRHIVEDNPTKEELKEWFQKSGLPIKRFFNTSGKAYREAGMKDKIPTMTEEEIFEILASNGMMVKRPIVVADEIVLVGFKENDWREKIIE